MTAKKSPSTIASKSTQLTDAPQTTVSTPNPDYITKSDNSINPTALSFKIWSHCREMCYFIARAVRTEMSFSL